MKGCVFRGGGEALTYESDVRVPPSTSNVGSFDDKIKKLRQKKGVFQDKAHKNRGSFSEMHEKIGAFRAKMPKFLNIASNLSKFSKNSIFCGKIVTCLNIKCENEGSLRDKDVSGQWRNRRGGGRGQSAPRDF